ncbi:MAG: D-aminoacyl-tRNA deacylase [Acidilobus sp.]
MTLIRPAIVYSTIDPVGVRASQVILSRLGGRESSCSLASKCYELIPGIKLAGYDVDDVMFEFLDITPDPTADAIIVLSRHESSSKIKSLTVHFPGNPSDEARLGGNPRELSYAPADLGRTLLVAYFREAEAAGLLGEYGVTLEATHHGPSGNKKPVVFIEIGSTETEWSDRRALNAMTNAIQRALETGPSPCIPAIGFGSTHYPRSFTSIELREDVCFGHIISKHAIRSLAGDIISQAVTKTLPGGARKAYIEKSSVKSSLRGLVTRELASLGIETIEL